MKGRGRRRSAEPGYHFHMDSDAKLVIGETSFQISDLRVCFPKTESEPMPDGRDVRFACKLIGDTSWFREVARDILRAQALKN